ncbi:MAG: conjugal transfer protein TraX [Treponema sp.]|jgi:hypothetical protein|nr:conjugal transfer protein TraX [Treponema sp.]
MNNDNSTANSLRGNPLFGKWSALDGGAIKIIGIILMAMDHMHQMFINQGAPVWLGWFGRPVAPMFLFLCAEGFYYTRNKRLYMLRFLGACILMNLGNQILGKLFPVENVELINNIFGALFLCVFYMFMVDLFREGIREKKPGRIVLALGGFLLPLVVGFVLLILLFGKDPPNQVMALLFFFIPTPFSVEGGIFQVVVGVLFYALRKYRWAQALVPVAMGLLVAFTGRGESGIPDAQWLMVFAALPILLYNGRRGWQAKYFFYAFYPAHIYLFYLAAWFLRPAG